VLETESVEVGAVMLSKLPVARAAELLGQVPGDKARRIAYAVSLTGDVDPETVRRIGLSLAAQLEQQPPRAFDRGPVERVGAILNQSPAATRDQVLQGLDDTDAAFAGLVRKAIFTFAHIPERLEPRDVPKVLRAVDPATLNIALAVAERTQPEVSRFLLSNLSQRMADALREEVAAIGKVREKDAEAAMTAVITAIRDAEQAAEITLRQSEEEED
jgi:flagellar motor switch protein FliG